jgi:hypothetical protein
MMRWDACDDAFLALYRARRNGAAENLWECKKICGIGSGCGDGIAAKGLLQFIDECIYSVLLHVDLSEGPSVA